MIANPFVTHYETALINLAAAFCLVAVNHVHGYTEQHKHKIVIIHEEHVFADLTIPTISAISSAS